MDTQPQIGDKYEKNGVKIMVHHISDSQVYCGRWSEKGDDLVRVTLDTWREQIAGATKL